MMSGVRNDYERFHTSNGRKEIKLGSYVILN